MTTATSSATTILTVILDTPIACWRCGKVHMKKGARPWEFTCHRCHAHNESKPVE